MDPSGNGVHLVTLLVCLATILVQLVTLLGRMVTLQYIVFSEVCEVSITCDWGYTYYHIFRCASIS